MKKEARQNIIKKIITSKKVKTQDELVHWLKLEGLEVGQSTISRDIRDLNLTKISLPNAETYYILKDKEAEILSEYNLSQNNLTTDDHTPSYEARIRNVFHDSVLSVETAYFLIIIKTLPGMAQAAAHLIDLLHLEEIAGTIAGDDTIFVAVKNEDHIDRLKQIFDNLLSR